jgi:hypothetical protein
MLDNKADGNFRMVNIAQPEIYIQSSFGEIPTIH